MLIKNEIKLLLTGLLLSGVLLPSMVESSTMTQATLGKIVLQVDAHGEAWYVNPTDHYRYYLGRPEDAFEIMSALGIGITNAQLDLIPTAQQAWDGEQNLMQRVRGKIMLQVENHGEAWYVNPIDGKRYYLGRPADAFQLMQRFGIGISTANLIKIEPNVSMSSLHPQGQGDTEFVVLQNNGAYSENVSDWFVQNETDKKMTLGKHTILEPGATITLKNKSQEKWNDVSGTATLYNKKHALIDQYTYNTTDTVLLDIPFTTQAPHGNWSSPFNEACEEAILVMLDHYRSGAVLTPSTAETKILNIVEWEKVTYGWHEDTSADFTARTARDYVGLAATVSHDVSSDSIKHFLNQGKPVIAPVDGKMLGNPHYRNGGPYYHVILIIGYNGDQFITHDPGTQYGQNYYYSAHTLIPAIHDLTQPESAIATGTPAIVIVEP